MLHLVLGPDLTVSTQLLLDRIAAAADAGRGGQLLIVPEQFSFEMEKQLCARGGDPISRYADALSFTRLASRVESICGGAGRLWLDQGGRVIAAAHAVEQVQSRLKLFAPVCRKPEFLGSFLTAVDEFGGYGITSDALSAASARFSGQFAQKLEELSLLYESYLAVCAQAQDPVMRLKNLLTALTNTDFAADKDFYICLFSDFTALEQEIVEALILSGRTVTIALPQESASGMEVFPLSAETAGRFRKFCNSHNVPWSKEFTDYGNRHSPALEHLCRHISGTELPVFSGAHDTVHFARYPSADEECRAAAAHISDLVRKGARYREISVACADEAIRTDLLPRILVKAQIPYFTSGGEAVTQQQGTRIVLQALHAVSVGMETGAVLDYIKSGGTGLTDDACDRLENYARLWNISGKRWQQDWIWHPSGLGTEWRDTHRQALQKLNAWKTQGLGPLFALGERMRSEKTVSGCAHAVFAFLQDSGLDTLLQTWSDELYENGAYRKSQQVSQLYDILVNALEQFCLVIPDAVRTPEEFYRLYEKVLAQYSVGTIPATTDAVLLGSIGQNRGLQNRHVLLLGANEGTLPSCAQGNGILSEEERQQLLQLGLHMAPGRADVVERELGDVFCAVRTAGETFSMTCNAEPSYLMTRFAALTAQKVTTVQQCVLLDREELASFLLRRGEAASDLTVRQAMHELAAMRDHALGTISREHIDEIYGRQFSFSASKIDLLASCRFAYFLRYGLRLEPRKVSAFSPADFGTFVHDILEHTAREVMQRGGFQAVDSDEVQELAKQCIQRYVTDVLGDLLDHDERFRYLLDRHSKEALSVVRDLKEELSCSAFRPAEFELSFSPDGRMPPVYVSGKDASCVVTGFVDRVDIYYHGDAAYVRVVDYKTGRKEFDYADISMGEGLQMLIYLFALTRNGEHLFGKKLQPAGVLYHPARQDILSVKSALSAQEASTAHAEARRRKGLVIDNDIVLAAMEDSAGSPRYLPYMVKKDGTKSGDLANSAQMKLLEEHVFSTLSRLCSELSGGEILPNPLMRGPDNNACTYCDFKDVCRRDIAEKLARNYKKIGNAQFFAELEQKEEGHVCV